MRLHEMTEAVLEKLNNMERLLREINSKMDNFLGFEDFTAEERAEIETHREEIRKGEFVTFNDVFSE